MRVWYTTIIGDLLLNFDLMLASSLLILFLSASLDLPALADHMTYIHKTGAGHMVVT